MGHSDTSPCACMLGGDAGSVPARELRRPRDGRGEKEAVDRGPRTACRPPDRRQRVPSASEHRGGNPAKVTLRLRPAGSAAASHPSFPE